MRSVSIFSVTCGLAIAIALFPSLVANAKPLSEAECQQRVIEHADLLSKGASSAAEKEPDWVKANMTPADIERVKRLIQVEDDIRFRCFNVSVAGVTPGVLLGKGRNQPDDDDDEKDDDKGEAKSADKAKGKGEDARSGPDIPLPLRKPSAPKRAETLRFNGFLQN
ncbi:MAG: hypothetical protein VX871_12365 [Pseudomonadota bacterium]|nr:hypothetical protein [Pseudomonadota bacterium]